MDLQVSSHRLPMGKDDSSVPLDEFDQYLALSRGKLNICGLSSPRKSVSSEKHSSDLPHSELETLPLLRKERQKKKSQAVSRSPTQNNILEVEDTISDEYLPAHGLGDDWDLGEARPRSVTMPVGPAPRLRPPRLARLRQRRDELVHRVRAFYLTDKGTLVKGGEKYISSGGNSKTGSEESVNKGGEVPFSVLLLGDSGVGKGALVREFIDPSRSNHPFSSLDDDSDRCVSILLDGEESRIEFVEVSDQEVCEYVGADHIDAYVVVYSVEDRESFLTAVDKLYEIRQDGGRDAALILVANKTDLVRTRIIQEDEGKTAAQTYDCKYIEVSAAIDHKIDELLVGIVKQIRLIRSKREKTRVRSSAKYRLDETCCLLQARQNVLARIFKGDGNTTKSCDNLYVL